MEKICEIIVKLLRNMIIFILLFFFIKSAFPSCKGIENKELLFLSTLISIGWTIFFIIEEKAYTCSYAFDKNSNKDDIKKENVKYCLTLTVSNIIISSLIVLSTSLILYDISAALTLAIIIPAFSIMTTYCLLIREQINSIF